MKLSRSELVRYAVEGIEAERERLEVLKRGLVGEFRRPAAERDGARPERKKMSSAARKRMSAAMRKRWSEARKAGKTSLAKAKKHAAAS